MAKHLEKYTGTKTYMTPSGELFTPQSVLSRYPAVSEFAHIVETDESGEVMFALQNLSALRSMYGVSASLTESEAIAAIETIVNTVPEYAPTAEDRIAAALEFSNILSMEDATV